MGGQDRTALLQLLESEMRERRWTWGRLAKECHLAPSTVYSFKQRRNVPQVATLRALADGLHLPFHRLAEAAGLAPEELAAQLTGSEGDMAILIMAWSRLSPADLRQVVELARTLLDGMAPPGL